MCSILAQTTSIAPKCPTETFLAVMTYHLRLKMSRMCSPVGTFWGNGSCIGAKIQHIWDEVIFGWLGNTGMWPSRRISLKM